MLSKPQKQKPKAPQKKQWVMQMSRQKMRLIKQAVGRRQQPGLLVAAGDRVAGGHVEVVPRLARWLGRAMGREVEVAGLAVESGQHPISHSTTHFSILLQVFRLAFCIFGIFKIVILAEF